MFHIVYTSEYLTYLGNVIYEAVSKTGIDGFMIDALFTAPRDSAEAMKWMPCERQIYEELFAKRANPDCIVWLTCHDLTHPQIRPGSRIFKQADWLMSENSDAKYLKIIQDAIGPHTQLIQCISGWASHDAKSLLDQNDGIMNIEEMTKFYKGNK